jgi:Tfp pilus assembly ATPase PilU
MLNLHQLLKILVESNGSVLHITTNSPPQMRVDGHLIAMDFPPMNQVGKANFAIVLTTPKSISLKKKMNLICRLA